MPRGPLPKPADERERRNSPAGNGPQILAWDGNTRGPELPLNLPGIKWSIMTFKWWDVWRNSAQAMVMLDTDWMVMLETAFLVNEFWKPQQEAVTNSVGKIIKRAVPRPAGQLKALSSEIRQRCEAFGATYRDRQVRGMIIYGPEDVNLTEKDIERAAAKAIDHMENYKTMVADEIARQRKQK